MSEVQKLVSPITNGKVKLVFEIEKEYLISRYKMDLNIETESIFQNTKTIQLYECVETGFRFFYPLDIAGDGKFYEQLEIIPWYYAQWKWDYKEGQKHIEDETKVLDIGCGEGKFLDYLTKEKKCNCNGLELNVKAKEIAVAKGLNVVNEFIQSHAETNENKYDVVTFFQVLEHIADANSFIKAAVACAKKGGKVIIAVPNNYPFFLKYDKMHLLNLPPHHMNWWDAKSLKAIAPIYNMKLETMVTQPLEHYTDYTNGFLKDRFANNLFFQKLLFKPFKLWFYLNRKSIPGASIIAVYSKL
jgi:methionine biosynthesis protein MetW